jgi:hypothetical protein
VDPRNGVGRLRAGRQLIVADQHLYVLGTQPIDSELAVLSALDGADLIDTPHVAEALQYRKREGD